MFQIVHLKDPDFNGLPLMLKFRYSFHKEKKLLKNTKIMLLRSPFSMHINAQVYNNLLAIFGTQDLEYVQQETITVVLLVTVREFICYTF